MPRSKVIAWAATGLLLSTTLAGCGSLGSEPPAPEPVVIVREVKVEPPAELLRCPVAPLGLPNTGAAVIPSDWRAALIRLAGSRGEVADQLARLITWHTGETCR